MNKVQEETSWCPPSLKDLNVCSFADEINLNVFGEDIQVDVNE